MTDVNRYPAQVFWNEEDEGFIALASDLPGCSAFGSTQNEALTELQNAIEAWLEAAAAAGNPIPPPSTPAKESAYSGKILLRMPKELHGQLASHAKQENVSLNQYLIFVLTKAIVRRASADFISGSFSIHTGIVVATKHWQKTVHLDPSYAAPLLAFSGFKQSSDDVFEVGNFTRAVTAATSNG